MIQFLEKIKNKFSKESVSAGLDIGTSTVKLVKLKFSNNLAELCGINVEPVEADAVSAVRKIIQTESVRKANISVSGSQSIIRNVSFPKMNDKELKQALKFEVQKYIPFSLNDINLDSFVLKPDLEGNKMLVLLAGVKKDILNQRLKLMDEIGITVNLVDVDLLSLINCFNFNYSDDEKVVHKAIALVNIGASQTNLNIMEDGIPRLSRDIVIASNTITQKISDAFGIDLKTAENLKLFPDKDRAEKIAPVVETVLANLAAEIRVSFDYYESQSASSVSRIYLSGGGSSLKGLKDMLANALDIEVENWDPLHKIIIPDSFDSQKVKAMSNQLAVAVGLALRY